MKKKLLSILLDTTRIMETIMIFTVGVVMGAGAAVSEPEIVAPITDLAQKYSWQDIATPILLLWVTLIVINILGDRLYDKKYPEPEAA